MRPLVVSWTAESVEQPPTTPLESGGDNWRGTTWVVFPGLVQGKDRGISVAGLPEGEMVEAESYVFDEIQASAAEKALSFWSDPAEDIYEDVGEQ